MGSRLGTIVLTESGPELYYDHWAAQTIGMDIAVDGFEATLTRVREMEPLGVASPNEWRGATWIEGSLLIDLPRQRVVWAEESEFEYLPRIVNHLIEQTWPGWEAVWSPEGVRGILWLAGVDPATIFSEYDRSPRASEDLAWFVPWRDGGGDGGISVRLGNGQLVLWRGESFLDTIAGLGPATIHAVAEEALARSQSGELALWDDQHCDELPSTGIHIDFTSKVARWWAIGDDDNQIAIFDALWPEWSIETVGDAYEFHERVTGKPMRVWPEDVVTVRRIVERMVDNGPRENPIVRMVSLLADRGERVSINADVLKFRPASDFGGARRAMAALDQLDSTCPLPPARFVNRHGRMIGPSTGDGWSF
ncbi:hypothetical protein [Mycobacterium aquaticum]|uniref:Uncharacterized protein n=1 Tax=Mycobacterium aquaticum TaxID=1927124 RepID=A0A1W9ZXV2_9MYCO|nr:hypothetical protein [Mycobacterium aquaticum]ORA22591.1 hypothetical protein BST13_36060 [Mycobacterium aquaticum]